MNDNFIKKCFAKIDKNDVISFDVFDTLIYRKTYNALNLYEYMVKINNQIPSDFAKKRKDAEQQARLRCNKYDVSLNDIYKFYDCDNDLRDMMIRLEEQFELDYCCSKEIGKKLYEYALKVNKKIIIVSDMYHSKKQIKSMLIKCGFTDFFDLFVSSEYNATKSHLNLYKIVKKKIGVKCNKIIHIGDNKKSDYICAKLSGFNSILIKDKDIFSLIKNHNPILKNYLLCNYKNDFMYEFGYSCLGPLVYGFSRWLYSKMKEFKYDKIFFLSREGNYLKKSFELFNESNMKTEYMFVSRRSLGVASLIYCEDYNSIINSLSLRKNETVRGFLESLGLFNELKVDLDNLSLDECIYDSDKMEIFINKHISFIKKRAIEEIMIIKRYFSEIDFSGNIAIVDIGWNGTMQNMLVKICSYLNIQVKIDGFYMGVRKKSISNNNFGRKFGYVYSPEDNINESYCRGFNGLFEQVFSAFHGSTIGYSINDEKVTPILENLELNKNMLDDLSIIQDSGLDFVKDLLNEKYYQSLDLSKDDLIINFLSFGTNPKLIHLKFFQNFEGKNVDVNSLIIKRPIFYYFFHLNKIKVDLCNSGWKIGYLKKLFKLKLPYKKIFKILQRI